MAARALQKARELSVAAKKGVEECRAFVSHLITLPSYHNLEATKYFVTLVSLYFSKFEDLQDATVDAVLDLCEDEDEEIRLQGIEGLGKTARADPRWVRGNAGVLLQLLECRKYLPSTGPTIADPSAERELKAVKGVLSNLLNLSALSACHVLGVMADDCKGSEEETGASRRNIIRYLHVDCAEFRQKQLNSGANPAGENIFRVGFLDVLKSAEAPEVRDILDMLLPLPTISGAKAKPDASAAFVRALSDSLKAGSTVKESAFHIQQFTKLVSTTPGLDEKAALYFFERHGGAVVESALYDREKDACALVRSLQAWTAGLQQRWDSKGQSEEEGKGAKDLATPLVSDVAHWSKEVKSQADIVPCCAELEYILLTIYQLCRNRDRRDDILYRKAESFVRLAGIAQEPNPRPNEVNRRKLENIGRMAKVLGDHSTPFVDIIPSWLPAPVSRPGLPIAPMGRAAASASFVPRTAAGQRGPQPAGVARPSPTTFAQPTGPVARQLPPHMALNGSTPARNPALNGTPPSGPATRPNGMAINGHGSKRTEPIDISDDDEPPSRTTAPRVSVPSSSSLPPSGPSSSRGRELISQPQSSVSEDVVMAEPKSTPSVKPLAERLSSSTKRTREELPPPTPPSLPSSSSTRSLGSRISSGTGPRPDEPEVKRSRPAEAPLSEAKPRLNSRMSAPNQGIIPRSRQLIETSNGGLPSSSSLPSFPAPSTPSPAPAIPLPPPPTSGFSIRSRAAPVAEEPIVKRGRGRYETDEEKYADFTAVERKPPAAAPSPADRPKPAVRGASGVSVMLSKALKDADADVRKSASKINRDKYQSRAPAAPTVIPAAGSHGALLARIK